MSKRRSPVFQESNKDFPVHELTLDRCTWRDWSVSNIRGTIASAKTRADSPARGYSAAGPFASETR